MVLKSMLISVWINVCIVIRFTSVASVTGKFIIPVTRECHAPQVDYKLNLLRSTVEVVEVLETILRKTVCGTLKVTVE